MSAVATPLCLATTDGPRHWPCTRQPHDDRGHVFHGDTWPDHHHDDDTGDDQ